MNIEKRSDEEKDKKKKEEKKTPHERPPSPKDMDPSKKHEYHAGEGYGFDPHEEEGMPPGPDEIGPRP